MENRLAYGMEIEKHAKRWLLSSNPFLHFLKENYRWKGGEIDLIFEDRRALGPPELVFVEVRARDRASWANGIESVTFPKQVRIARTIQHFLARYQGPCESLRFDILAWDGENWTHLQNQSLPEEVR